VLSVPSEQGTLAPEEDEVNAVIARLLEFPIVGECSIPNTTQTMKKVPDLLAAVYLLS
jgi:hypothetical protein